MRAIGNELSGVVIDRRAPHAVALLRRARLTLVAAALASGGPAFAGLVINPIFNTGTWGAQTVSAVEAAFNYAASEFENLYSDNIHINIAVSGGTSGLGGSNTNLFGFLTYGQVRTALINDNTAHSSADGTTSVASLGAADPTGGTGANFVVSRAEAKALGLIPDDLTTDGTFTFNRNFSYTFDPNNRGVSGAFDFIGVAEHEISEIMGRIPSLGKFWQRPTRFHRQ